MSLVGRIGKSHHNVFGALGHHDFHSNLLSTELPYPSPGKNKVTVTFKIFKSAFPEGTVYMHWFVNPQHPGIPRRVFFSCSSNISGIFGSLTRTELWLLLARAGPWFEWGQPGGYTSFRFTLAKFEEKKQHIGICLRYDGIAKQIDRVKLE